MNIPFLSHFTKPSVDGALSSLNKALANLHAAVEHHLDLAGEHADTALIAQAMQAEATAEAERAKRIAGNLEAILK